MKETIAEIKSGNGNINFTQKEMLWYLIHRMDGIDKRVNASVTRTMFYWVIGGLTGIFAFFATWLK